MNFPGAITVDATGDVYFNDDVNYRVRRISGSVISTVAGNGAKDFSGDGGAAGSAALNGNFGIATDLSGNLFIADWMNNRVREIYSVVPGYAPEISTAGFTNAASFATGGSPEAIATIFGAHLTRNLSGILQNSGAPLPGSLAGTSVTIDGKTAPLFSAVNLNGQEQISFQIPVDATPGSSVQFSVSNEFAVSKMQIALSAVQPGIFPILDGTQAAALAC